MSDEILEVRAVQYLDRYRLKLEFSNGVSGVVDLENELYGEVFEPLREPLMFQTARIHEIMGTVVWDNGADLAPEHLFALLEMS